MPSILKALLSPSSGRESYESGAWGQGMVRYGGGSSTPRTVSTDSALTLSAVFACIRLLSENVATLPMDTYTAGSDGTRDPFEMPDYLRFLPPRLTRLEYLSQLMLSLLAHGNAYVATPRGPNGEPIMLVPLDPCKVKPALDKYGDVVYRWNGETYTQFDVLHIKGMTMPASLVGLSPLGYAMRAVDLGLQAQEFGASFLANGAVPAGVVEAPGEAPRDLAERMAALWDSRHRGAGNAGKVGVLTGGAKFTQITVNPDQAQLLESRMFSVPDIARFFGVPPHLIADASSSTSWGSGLSEQNAAFAQMSLRPWVTRIEDAHNRLLASYGLPEVYVKLNMDAGLRATTKERYDAYAVALSAGFMDDNEVRLLEDLELKPVLPAPEPEVQAALDLARAAPSLVQNPGLPALVNQLRLLNGKPPLEALNVVAAAPAATGPPPVNIKAGSPGLQPPVPSNLRETP